MATRLSSYLLDGTQLPVRLSPSQVRAGSGDSGVDTYLKQIRVPAVGLCPDRPVHIHFLPDSSGSITAGTGSADPVGLRWSESLLAIERVGKRCTCKDERASIHHFDTHTSLDVAAASIATERAAIEAGLAIPPDAAGRSELGRSLRAAERSAQADPDHHHILVALTDFALVDWPAFKPRLAAFPGSVYAAVLRGSAAEFDAEPNIQAISIDSNSAPGALAQFIFGALNATRKPTQIMKAKEQASRARRRHKASAL